MKRIVNCRIPLLFAIALAVGIGLGYLAFTLKVDVIYLLAIIPVTAVVFIFALFFVRSLGACILFAVLSLILLSGALYSNFTFENYCNDLSPSSETYIVADVERLIYADEQRNLILDNVYCDGIKLDGKLYAKLTSTSGELCDDGDKISFNSTISIIELQPYGILSSKIIEGVKYTCTVYSGLKTEEGFSLFGTARSFIRDTLYDNCDGSTAAVALAMLIGDTGGVDEGISDTFKYGGVAHIFAISGGNVVVLYGVVYAILKLFKLKRGINELICIAVLILSLGIFGFTVSAVRAVIMCIVLILCRLVMLKYDMLNSLSISIVLILLINPLDLFSAGFQLSVLSVAGIALFNSVFRKKFAFIPKFGDEISVSLAAQMGTLPAMFSCFGYVSVAGLLLNVIVLPLLSYIFILIFACVFLAALIPPLSGLIISVSTLPLEALISLMTVGGFENALFTGFGGALFMPLFYLFTVFLSDKIRKSKLAFKVILISALSSLVLYACFARIYPLNGTYIAVSAYYGGGYTLFKNVDGYVLVITDGTTDYRLDTFLASCGASRLNAVIALGDENCANYLIQGDFNSEKLFIFGGYIAPDGSSVTPKTSFNECGIDFTFYDGYTVIAETNGVKTAICAGEFNLSGCDLVVGDCEAEGDYVVNFTSGNGDYCVYENGKISFLATYGRINRDYLF